MVGRDDFGGWELNCLLILPLGHLLPDPSEMTSFPLTSGRGAVR